MGTERDNSVCFSFGVIADIQYADVEDGYNFMKTRKRYYRNSITLLSEAVEEWNKDCMPPSFILQLGDIIDGLNAQHKASKKALKNVMQEFKKSKADIHHIWGNHEFYNFSRHCLMSSALNSQHLGNSMTPASSNRVNSNVGEDKQETFYCYDFCPFPSFRFVVIDCYDLSTLGREDCSKKYQESLKIIRKINKNEDLNNPEGLGAAKQRFVQFNGGLSQDQLEWLDEVLSYSDENQEKVIVVGHIPVHPCAADTICLVWNFDDVLAVLYSHKCVVSFMAGHDHDGGYFQDERGIHHITFEGVIETPPTSHAFGTVFVYKDKMILKGNGRVPHRVMPYPECDNQ
ncbi:manganese-dependent ADP-ribose/CDP-alcohol diphosphatase [Protopterus annectens]|uniref:manganese-dependent ADP-ribose/CDP-alcohol diphosphatase n=1 Tax=Protopterus annectens TaxID=7888 RepID=UPI001CF97FB8|nr:manganese-dependent ADP-ribose/CDP-alcohol diphosphatase [Protopterus annectens]